MANWFDNIPAPMDANGCVVPLDTKELVCRGETREVYCFVYSIGRGSWFVEFGDCVDIRLSDCTMPDSWERLEGDLEKGRCGYFGYADKSCVECPAYGSPNCSCSTLFASDVLRRAKALAERDAKGAER